MLLLSSPQEAIQTREEIARLAGEIELLSHLFESTVAELLEGGVIDPKAVETTPVDVRWNMGAHQMSSPPSLPKALVYLTPKAFEPKEAETDTLAASCGGGECKVSSTA